MLYKFTWPLMKRLIHLVFIYLGGIRRVGFANVPRYGGVLICPNHVSDADPCAIAAMLPRDAYYMAKEEVFAPPVLGFLLRLYRVFPIRPNSADRAALRYAEELLKAGEAVVIFPEGGGNAENTLQPLYPGAMLLALRCDVPVVPVALTNTGKVWRYGDLRPNRAGVMVGVEFGRPLDLTPFRGKPRATDKATRLLTETLAEMLGQPIPDAPAKTQSKP